MAMSALKPGGGIHPLVGSLFSAPVPGASLESRELQSQEIEEIVSAREPGAPVGPVAASPAVPAPPRSPAAPTPGAETDRDRRVPSPTSSQHGATTVSPLTREHPASLDTAEQKQPATLTDDLYERTDSVTRSDEALVPVSPAPTASAFHSLPSSAGRVSSLRSVVPQSRVADEIEIRIGRIEISAVQPAPAQPVAAKPKPRPSLEEYLRRRDGRS
jgi:hypothetical protein